MRRSPYLASAVAALLVAGCGQSGATHPATGTHPGTTATIVTTVRQRSLRSHPHRRPTPNRRRPPLGSLPQTMQRPSAHSAVFHREMRDLWRGVVRNSPSAARPAFFPVLAYLKVKSIPDARGDWSARLFGDYRLDLGAAHDLLDGGAPRAKLEGVQVPAAYAHWVPPGACYNRVGYWEVPNARVVYREGGQLRSFGIASMISWRGVWYVVHLGAVLRSADAGVVDAPSSGTGVSIDSGTC